MQNYISKCGVLPHEGFLVKTWKYIVHLISDSTEDDSFTIPLQLTDQIKPSNLKQVLGNNHEPSQQQSESTLTFDESHFSRNEEKRNLQSGKWVTIVGWYVSSN